MNERKLLKIGDVMAIVQLSKSKIRNLEQRGGVPSSYQVWSRCEMEG